MDWVEDSEFSVFFVTCANVWVGRLVLQIIRGFLSKLMGNLDRSG